MSIDNEPVRAYGTHSSDEFDVLCEGTAWPDGTIHHELVIIDKRPLPPATD